MDPTIDIFSEGVAPPPTLRYSIEPDYSQVVQFTQDPEAFKTVEAIEGRYKKGRIDIERKRAGGGYGIGDEFDRSAFEADFKKLNQALAQGMPARIFPAFMPLTPEEADQIVLVASKGRKPTLEEQAAPKIAADIARRDAIEGALRPLDPSRRFSQGIESLLSRVGGDMKKREFLLRQDIQKIPSTALEALKQGKPEIRFFAEKGERGMPGQMGLRFTKRFQPKVP